MIKPLGFSQNIYSAQPSKKANPTFKGTQQLNLLTKTNIGNCADGFIGRLKVRLGNGSGEALLNLSKRTGMGLEEYKIYDDFERIIGEVQIKIKKFVNYDRLEYPVDPSHVFVDNLRNYSKPGTPYHNKDLPYYKDIGTRFLQIAQRRSDESGCNGNIKLIAKNESMPFYKNVIHMKEEFPPNSPFKFLHNPNSLYLPPEWKEALSKLKGGL